MKKPKRNPSPRQQKQSIPDNVEKIIFDYIKLTYERAYEKAIAKGESDADKWKSSPEDIKKHVTSVLRDMGFKSFGLNNLNEWTNFHNDLYYGRYLEAGFILRFFTSHKLMPFSYIRRKNKWLYNQLFRIRENIKIYFGKVIRNNDLDSIYKQQNLEAINSHVKQDIRRVETVLSHTFTQEININKYAGKWYINQLDNFRLDFSKSPWENPNIPVLNKINELYEEKLVEENANQGLDPKEECHRPFLKLNSEWTWYMDESGRHAKTGEYMGHCGNVPQYKDGDVLLNLGKNQKDGTYIPKLTFILNRGILGERKGQANSKPKAEYHPQIMALLRDPKIIWLGNGQYKPENDFQLKDLSAENQQTMKEIRPELFDIKLMLKKIANSQEDFLGLVNEYYPFWEELEFKKDKDTYVSKKAEFKVFQSKFLREDEISQHCDNQIYGAVSRIGEPYDYDQKITESEKRKIFNKAIDEIKTLKSFKGKYGKMRSRKVKLVQKVLNQHIQIVGRTVGPVYAWSRSIDKLLEQAVRDSWTWVYSSQEQNDLDMSLSEGRTASGFYYTDSNIDSDNYKTQIAIDESDLARGVLWKLDMMDQPYEGDDLSKYISDGGDHVDGPDVYEYAQTFQNLLFDNLNELAGKTYFSEKEREEDEEEEEDED